METAITILIVWMIVCGLIIVALATGVIRFSECSEPRKKDDKE